MTVVGRKLAGDRPTNRWLVLAVMSISVYLVAVTNTTVNVALPSLAREFSASNATLQWVVDGYILIFASLLLLGGTIGDRFGRRRALTIGMAIFALGSVGAALSSHADALTLILMRGVQGAGAALVMPPTLSILTAVFERTERAKAIGIWTGVSGMGFMTGPLLGGFLTTHVDWTAIFWVAMGIALISLVGLLVVPESKDSRQIGLDVPGAVLATAGMLALVYGIIEGNDAGWTSTEILIAFGIAFVLLSAFVVVELRSEIPMLPLRFFKRPAFTGAVLVIGVVFLAVAALGFFVQQYFQIVQGHSALGAGLRTFPMGVMIMLIAPLSVPLTVRFGPKAMVVAGTVVATLGLLWFSQLNVDSGYPPALAGFLLIGIGGGLSLTPLTDTVMASIPVDDAGIGSAINDTSRELGGALGIAGLGAVVSSMYSSGVKSDLDGLAPDTVVDAASEGVVVAEVLAGSLDADAAALVTSVANANFTDAFTTAFLIGAVILVIALIAVATLIPRRMSAQQAIQDRPATSTARRAPGPPPASP